MKRIVETTLALALFCAPICRAQIYINELMASNDSTLADEAGEFDDWFELYNAGAQNVSLSGYAAINSRQDSSGWAFPDTVIPAGGYLIVWADDDEEQGPLHTSFKLNRDGEVLALIDATPAFVDSLTFPPVGRDSVYARVPDGSANWILSEAPTPGAANYSTGIENNSPAPANLGISLSEASPNPFNPHTQFTVELEADSPDLQVGVYSLRGDRIRSLHRGPAVAGRHTFAWNGLAESGASVASGTYILRVHDGKAVQTRRMILLK